MSAAAASETLALAPNLLSALTAPNIVLPAAFLAVTVVFIAAEYLAAYLARHDHADHGGGEASRHHDLGETAASFGVAVGDLVVRVITSGLAAIPFFWLYERRLFEIPLDTVAAVVALFLGVEFCYYWFHRASHRVRWLWATHAVHHSATHFNLSAAIRLGWTGQLTGAFVFFLPLAWIGFHPLAIAATIGLGLVYQFFLHTRLNITLGPLEWVLNTPTHHRVHHASNDRCLDRNYGSVLIIWDRLFGTFATAPADEPLRYGLKGRAPSRNPLRIALGEWAHLLRDTARAPGLAAKLRTLFGTP
jgi:sterol desaturase/sphingolipid hydroxylase (fatty acid hydroxylase superfamily)